MEKRSAVQAVATVVPDALIEKPWPALQVRRPRQQHELTSMTALSGEVVFRSQRYVIKVPFSLLSVLAHELWELAGVMRISLGISFSL